MFLRLLKSKLHQATVTAGRLDYHGSITIDPELMREVGLVPFEAVLVANTATGLRAETYVITGRPGGRQIELNGALARLGQTGDRIIVFAFAHLTPDEVPAHQARVAILDERNEIVESFAGTTELPKPEPETATR